MSTYIFKSPVKLQSPLGMWLKPRPYHVNTINDHDMMELDLAEYLPSDLSCIKSISLKVEILNSNLWCISTVTSESELDQTQIDYLTDVLEGQFSDGWGESMEQIMFRFKENTFYALFWDFEKWTIELT